MSRSASEIASEGVITSPAAGLLLADLGAEAKARTFIGNAVCWMETGGAAATAVSVEHRNVANDTTIVAITINLLAAQTVSFPVEISLAAGERLRIINGLTDPGATEDVHCSLVGHYEDGY